MNKRNLKLDEYGINSKRYKELCGFCEQYPDWVDELKYSKNALKSIEITDMPAANTIGNQTQNLAIKRELLQKKCELIEQTAIEASADLYQYIIKSVCYNQPFWYLRDIMNMPCSERTFFDSRRFFFHILDEKKF